MPRVQSGHGYTELGHIRKEVEREQERSYQPEVVGQKYHEAKMAILYREEQLGRGQSSPVPVLKMRLGDRYATEEDPDGHGQL